MGVWIETAYRQLVWNPSNVTPCMGVWIETACRKRLPTGRRSHPVWVCGLKPYKSTLKLNTKSSHPVWVCGLKLHVEQLENTAPRVTPCMGVWIETPPTPCQA